VVEATDSLHYVKSPIQRNSRT